MDERILQRISAPRDSGNHPPALGMTAQQQRASHIVTMIGRRLGASKPDRGGDLAGGRDVVVSAWLSDPLGAAGLARKRGGTAVLACCDYMNTRPPKFLACRPAMDSGIVALADSAWNVGC
jgi:hypothetical protein